MQSSHPQDFVNDPSAYMSSLSSAMPMQHQGDMSAITSPQLAQQGQQPAGVAMSMAGSSQGAVAGSSTLDGGSSDQASAAALLQQQQAQLAQTGRKLSGRYALADFTLQRTLGTGSFGRVHLVRSKHNMRFYAIKVSKRCSPTICTYAASD